MLSSAAYLGLESLLVQPAGASRRQKLKRSSEDADMPTYEYLCMACHKTFSKILTLAEAGKQKLSCPHCHSTKIEQRYSTFYPVTSKKSA